MPSSRLRMRISISLEKLEYVHWKVEFLSPLLKISNQCSLDYKSRRVFLRSALAFRLFFIFIHELSEKVNVRKFFVPRFTSLKPQTDKWIEFFDIESSAVFLDYFHRQTLDVCGFWEKWILSFTIKTRFRRYQKIEFTFWRTPRCFDHPWSKVSGKYLLSPRKWRFNVLFLYIFLLKTKIGAYLFLIEKKQQSLFVIKPDLDPSQNGLNNLQT